MHYLLAAILFLAPHLSKPTARNYARIIRTEAARKQIDPLLVVSFIHVETFKRWDPRVKSVTNDYGLCQVHVAVRGSARFLGREEELYNPRTNVHEWVRLADMWRAYHRRACNDHHHLWWAHLKWGYRVKDQKHAHKVRQIFEMLKRRFRPEAVAQLEEG
jgi:hypothetical protein